MISYVKRNSFKDVISEFTNNDFSYSKIFSKIHYQPEMSTPLTNLVSSKKRYKDFIILFSLLEHYIIKNDIISDYSSHNSIVLISYDLINKTKYYRQMLLSCFRF